MSRPFTCLFVFSLNILLLWSVFSAVSAQDDDPSSPPCAEGCDDPEPNQELEEPGPDDGPDDDGSGCSHRYLPRIGQPKTNPSASATIYHHPHGTTALNGEPLKFKVGDQAALRVEGGFSPGIEWPEVPDPALWETISNERTTAETKFTGEGGGGRVWEKTFAEKWDGKVVKATHKEAWTVTRQYPVTCAKCNTSKKVTRTANPQKEAEAQVTVTAFTLKLQVRRKGGGSFSDRAKIAAGGLGSDVHVAEIEATLDPAGEDGDRYSFGVKVTADDPAYKPGPRQPHASSWLTWDDDEGAFVGSITANHKGWVCEHDGGTDENNEPITVKHYYELVSSAQLGGATISGTGTGVSASASASFEWADPEWDYDSTFTPDEYEPVSLTALDLDGEALEGHAIWVYAMQVELDSLFFDSEEWELFWDQETIDRREDDPLTRYTHFTGDPLAAAPGDGIGRAAVNGDGEITVHQWVESVAGSTDEEWEEYGLVGRVVNQVQFKAADVTVYE